MPYSIVELAPVNQYATIGYSPPTAQTPAVFGSVADDSDATFTTLEAEYQESGDRYSEVLTLDFALPDPTMVPAFYYMKMRARDNADFAAHPERFVEFMFDYSAVADSPGTTFDSWSRNSSGASSGQFGALANGEVIDPAWFDFAYMGDAPVDTANPTADTWFQIDNGDTTGYVAHQTYAALAGSGLRFTFYPRADSNLDPRTAYIDVYEVRMVVAYVQAAAPYVAPARATPSLRMLQRGGEGGMSGIPRMIGNPVRGLRQGPGSVY